VPNSYASGGCLEVQTNRAFKESLLIPLFPNEPERVSAVDIKDRVAKKRRHLSRATADIRMVQDVCSVHPDLEVLRLTDPDDLGECGVKRPLSGKFHCLPPKCTSLSGLRILEEDLACLRIGNCLNRTVGFEVRGHCAALGIRHSPKAGPKE